MHGLVVDVDQSNLTVAYGYTDTIDTISKYNQRNQQPNNFFNLTTTGKQIEYTLFIEILIYIYINIYYYI